MNSLTKRSKNSFPSLDPFTQSSRVALDYCGMMINGIKPSSVNIISEDKAVVQQCMLRLSKSLKSASFSSYEQIPDLYWPFPTLERDRPAEVTWFPFSFELSERELDSQHVILCFRNRNSYRKLLYPNEPAISYRDVKDALQKAGYQVRQRAGVCTPGYVFWMAFASATGHHYPSLHFLFQNFAFQRILKTSGLWAELSYLVVLYACR
jgi:hypothetical protein